MINSGGKVDIIECPAQPAPLRHWALVTQYTESTRVAQHTKLPQLDEAAECGFRQIFWMVECKLGRKIQAINTSDLKL